MKIFNFQFSTFNFQFSTKKVLWMLLLLLLPGVAMANTDSEYSVTKYHVDIKANEDNTFLITQQIRVHFYVPKHGIDIEIPLRNEVVHSDGTKSLNRVKITDIDVEEELFETDISNGKKEIWIGDTEVMISGDKEYIITYLYDIRGNSGKNCCELYLNLIGSEWDTSIDSITFTITMPKGFDASALEFLNSTFGAIDSDKISYEVNGLVISGSYNEQLNAGEVLIARMKLPEGYFISAASSNPEMWIQFSFALPIFFLLIILAMWYVYGKDETVIGSGGFYPPKGYNSAEIGFLYKGKADIQDVVSLLIYLANKGYIKITETREKALFSTVEGFTITKLKDYDGDNPNERLFLKGLFQAKTQITSFKEMMSLLKTPESIHDNESAKELTEVTFTDLKCNFYLTLGTIITNMNKKENRESIFEKSSLNKTWPTVLMTIASFLLITVPPMLEYYDDLVMFLTLLFTGAGFLIFFLTLFTDSFKNIKTNGVPAMKRSETLIFGLGFGVLFGGIPFVVGVLPALLLEKAYWMAFIVGMICIVLMLLLNKYMTKRTPLGNELLGKIKGFKRSLETAEKYQLEQLAKQTPDYFQQILPFTYALGITNVWIKKFNNIAIQQPDWYSGTAGFNHASFSRFIKKAMKSAAIAMSSSPSKSRR